MGTSIVMTSGKGGTGKTTCCAALASFLARSGRRTLCVDCDAALRDLDIVLGLSEGVLYDFMDAATGRVELDTALTKHPQIDDLWFLSAPTELTEDADTERLRELMGELKARFDYILLDSPAGIGPGFRLAASLADSAVIVTTGDTSSLRDGQRTAWELRALGICEIRLLVNRVRPRALRRVRRDIDDIIDTVGARLLGVVSEDPDVAEAGDLGIPLLLYGSRNAWGQLRDAAARTAGERVKLGKIR